VRAVLGGIAVLFVASVAGIFVGRAIAEKQLHGTRLEQRASVQLRLESDIRGIVRGSVFPDIPLWEPGGDNPRTVSEILPNGGILPLVSSGCEDCIDDVRALYHASKSIEESAARVIVVGNNVESTVQLEQAMKADEIRLSLYCDVTQVLHRDHHVLSTPCYFWIGEDGALNDFGGGKRSVEEFEDLVEKLQRANGGNDGENG